MLTGQGIPGISLWPWAILLQGWVNSLVPFGYCTSFCILWILGCSIKHFHAGSNMQSPMFWGALSLWSKSCARNGYTFSKGGFNHTNSFCRSFYRKLSLTKQYWVQRLLSPLGFAHPSNVNWWGPAVAPSRNALVWTCGHFGLFNLGNFHPIFSH